jgi:O-antigen ligase
MIHARHANRPRGGSSGAAHAVVGLMLVLMPVVSVQGPANTTPMDLLSGLFIAAYACHVLVRRPTIRVPMAVPFWLVMLGSLIGLYAAHDPGRSLLLIVKELYLYAWFVCTANFVIHHCRAHTVAASWVAVATSLGLLMAVDRHTGAFGGFFSDVHRAAGTFENPNMAGNYMTLSFFLAWAVAQTGARWGYLAMVACVAGGLATASNGTQLSLAVGSAVVLLARSGRRRGLFVGIGCIAAGVAIAVLGVGHTTIKRTILAQVSQGNRDQLGGTAMEGASERLPLWLDAAHEFRQTPTGVGPDNFNRQGGAISGDFHGAHNTYVGMLVERGPIGLAGWLSMLGAVLVLLRSLRAVAPSARPFGVEPLLGALAAITAHALTMEVFHFRHLWMFVAILYAARVQAQMPSPVETPHASIRRPLVSSRHALAPAGR